MLRRGPATPPTVCTTPDPAKSTYPTPSSSRVAELGQPAAAPRPRTEDRVVDRAAEEAPTHERLPLPPFRHGAGGDGRHRVHERDHVQEEGHAAGGVERLAGAGPATLPEEDPVARTDEVLADRAVHADERERIPTEHQRIADEVVGDEPETEDREVRRDDVRRVLGAAEARLDQREAGLHEDHEHRADDDPEQVHLDAERVDGFLGGLRAGRACEQQREHPDQRGGEDQLGDPPPHHVCVLPRRGSRLVPIAAVLPLAPVLRGAGTADPRASARQCDRKEDLFRRQVRVMKRRLRLRLTSARAL